MNDANSRCVESMNLLANDDSYEQYVKFEIITDKPDLYSRRVIRKAIRKGRGFNPKRHPKSYPESYPKSIRKTKVCDSACGNPIEFIKTYSEQKLALTFEFTLDITKGHKTPHSKQFKRRLDVARAPYP